MEPEYEPQPSFWQRIALAAGIAYVVLLLIAAVAFPAPPGSGQSVAHDPTWLAGHSTSTLVQVYLRSLGALALLVFSVGLADVVRHRTDSRVLALLALAGGAGSALVVLLAQTATAAAALLVQNGGSPDVVRGLGSLEDAILVLSSLPLVLLLAPVGIALLRGRPWLAYLSLLGAAIALVEGAIFPGSPLDSVDFLPLFYMLLWSLVTSITLLVTSRGQRVAAASRLGAV